MTLTIQGVHHVAFEKAYAGFIEIRQLDHRHREKRRRAIRRLGAELLEKRILLTTVTSVDPLANSFNAAVSTNVSATFDEVINAATATPQNFVVHSTMRHSWPTTTVAAAGMTVTADPAPDLYPGEFVHVTATGGIQGAATANMPHVWQFRAGVTSGSGQFVETGQDIAGSGSQGAEMGDLDGDGDLDVFIAYSEPDQVWTNDGTGILTSVQQNLGTGNSRGVELGDLDGDGDLDAFVANNGTGNGVWLNGGNAQFTGSETLGVSGSYDLSLGDVDGDGDLDAFVANNFQPNRVWINDGNAGFTDSGQALGNSGSQGVELGDLDGDGDLDAFVANAFAGNRVWLNDGSGRFIDTGQSMLNNNSQDVSLGDFDGDGDLDAFVTHLRALASVFGQTTEVAGSAAALDHSLALCAVVAV